MVATSVLAFWAAALFVGPAPVGPKPDRDREGLRGPVQSVLYLGARSYNPGTGGAEAGAIFNNAELPVVAVLPPAAPLAPAPPKPCRFPMRSDRERDGLLGAVRKVECIRDPTRAIWTTCPSLETTYDHGGWIEEQVWADYDGSAAGRGVRRRNPTTGNVEVEGLDKTGNPTGIRQVITCDEASRTLTEETFTEQGGAGRRVLTFDAQGNPTVEETLYGDGLLNNRQIHNYDQAGRLTETTIEDSHDIGPGKVTYRYGVAGALMERDWYNKAGKLYSKEFFTYKLDSHGNWMERSSHSCEPSPGKPAEFGCGAPTTERRRIIYHDGVSCSPIDARHQ